MSMYVSGSRVTLVFFMAIFLAGCATPAPSPRLTATVVGSADATVSQSDAAAATAGSLPAPVLPPQMQSQMQPQMQPQAQPSAPASAALASNEHAEMTCAMHRKLMIAMTPEERQAVLAAHMRDMSPDMRKRYVERLKTCTGN